VTTDISLRRRHGRRRGPALVTDERDVGLRRQVVVAGGCRVVVRTVPLAGSVATILLHGAAGSWTTWTPLLRTAQRTGSPLTGVVAIDLPGWGESAPPVRSLDAAAMADLVGDVARALGYERWVVVGHSLGGFLALEIAARHPDRTDGVLLVSASGAGVVDAIRRPLRGGLALPGFAGMLLIMRVLAAFGSAGRAFVRLLGAVRLLRLISAPLFAAPARVHPSVIAAIAHEVQPQAFADAARAAASGDIERWRRITCPVRSIAGENDVFVADADAAGFADRIPDFVHHTVADAGHFAAVEQPQRVLGELRTLEKDV
jgi:pimeloyl-ACP methyl ester carboxylesterase